MSWMSATISEIPDVFLLAVSVSVDGVDKAVGLNA